MLIGPPGVGKSITIEAAAGLARNLEGIHVGPISLTGASLIDAMAGAKRTIPVFFPERETLEFNSLFIVPDDLQALLHEYNSELVGNLTIFYNTTPYSQTRRVSKLDIEITSPQLSILAGTTPSHLLKLLPAGAWEEGFMSRVIMVYSSVSKLGDDIFASVANKDTDDLEHDLDQIFSLHGQMAISDGFREKINQWRRDGHPPKPNHPKLIDYCTRREAQALKLSMISCADRGDNLRLEEQDLDRALTWLIAAEKTMPSVFDVAISPDAKVMQDIIHALGKGEVLEKTLMRTISNRVSTHMVTKMQKLLVDTGMIRAVRVDGGGNVFFKVTDSS